MLEGAGMLEMVRMPEHNLLGVSNNLNLGWLMVFHKNLGPCIYWHMMDWRQRTEDYTHRTGSFGHTDMSYKEYSEQVALDQANSTSLFWGEVGFVKLQVCWRNSSWSFGFLKWSFGLLKWSFGFLSWSFVFLKYYFVLLEFGKMLSRTICVRI